MTQNSPQQFEFDFWKNFEEITEQNTETTNESPKILQDTSLKTQEILQNPDESPSKKIQKNIKKSIQNILKNHETSITIGNQRYNLKISEENQVITLKIKSEKMKNFSTFQCSLSDYQVQKIENHNDTNETNYVIFCLNIKKIIKKDKYNGWPKFGAKIYGTDEMKDIYSFNFFKKFFGNTNANDAIIREIKYFLVKKYLQTQNAE